MSEQNVNIVDVDSLIYIVCYNKKDEPIKSLDEVFKSVDSFLETMFRETKSTHYLMYLTVGRGKRYEVYPEYKKNREGKEKPPLFDFVKEYLITKYAAHWRHGIESDDMCLASKKLLDKQGIKCFMSSVDNDVLMLEGVNYNYSKKVWVETNQEQAAYKFWGDMISGQTGDNIKGIPKKGPKYVEQLFASCHWSQYPRKVFGAYMDYYGEKGIEEMYKSYAVLKILESIEGFELPSVQAVQPGYDKWLETNERI